LSFRPYKPTHDGKPDDRVGWFMPTRDANYIAIDAKADDKHSMETVYHEYMHYVLSTRYLDIPLWFNEGMAEFYSTFRVEENMVEIGRPVESHVALLRSAPMIPLAQLFFVDSKSAEYNEVSRQGIFYAQSWALYHYLALEKSQMRPRLEAYVSRVS